MTAYYLDTSALIKRYVAEAGSRWIVNIVNSTPELLLFTSRLTVVEARSALWPGASVSKYSVKPPK